MLSVPGNFSTLAAWEFSAFSTIQHPYLRPRKRANKLYKGYGDMETPGEHMGDLVFSVPKEKPDYIRFAQNKPTTRPLVPMMLRPTDRQNV